MATQIKHVFFMFIVVIAACSVKHNVKKNYVTDDQLEGAAYEDGTAPLCNLIIERHVNECFTNVDSKSDRPIDVLHNRFIKESSRLSGLNGYDRNMMAFCSKGVILSCEMSELFDKAGYRRDALSLSELMMLIGNNESSSNEKLFNLIEYNSNSNLNDINRFEKILNDIISKMKENDKKWRRDWK